MGGSPGDVGEVSKEKSKELKRVENNNIKWREGMEQLFWSKINEGTTELTRKGILWFLEGERTEEKTD